VAVGGGLRRYFADTSAGTSAFALILPPILPPVLRPLLRYFADTLPILPPMLRRYFADNTAYVCVAVCVWGVVRPGLTARKAHSLSLISAGVLGERKLKRSF